MIILAILALVLDTQIAETVNKILLSNQMGHVNAIVDSIWKTFLLIYAIPVMLLVKNAVVINSINVFHAKKMLV